MGRATQTRRNKVVPPRIVFYPSDAGTRPTVVPGKALHDRHCADETGHPGSSVDGCIGLLALFSSGPRPSSSANRSGLVSAVPEPLIYNTN